MSWDFRIGQRVVCVNDDGFCTINRWLRFTHNLARGRHYTVTWTGLLHLATAPIASVAVAGGKWNGCAWGSEVSDHPQAFPAEWFRPLETRRTSLEVFDRILKGEPVAGAFDPQPISGKLPRHAHEAACSTDRNPS